MFSTLPRKKTLTTYSKKAQRINHQSTLASPSSHDGQYRRRRVTLTSPIRADIPPTGPSSISVSLSGQDDHEDDQLSQAETDVPLSEVQRRPEPCPARELAFATSLDRAASPVSSSEHDSISDEDLMPTDRGGTKRIRRAVKPQPLSKLRRSLNIRPKKLQLVVKQSTSILSKGTLRAIERGADGFDEMNLVLLAASKPRNTKRKVPNSIARLDIIRGPHPHVDFDHSDWLAVPYQDLLAQEPQTSFSAAEAAKEKPEAEEVFVGDVLPKKEGAKASSRPPARPSAKEALLYAQLSSVSAPIMRRSCSDEESEDGYANGFLYEGDGDLEQRMSDAEQEDLGVGSVS
ncbi:hypothetical protein M436DRAFT_50586 [Aureobasidium namibiae CBS 147.97]|uniref:Uncharacterized protein n=1 Tax=Aureobasidium namibiae CBS 147.97 TaxID=1043004 RepID=A0A074WJM5_9PEZI